MANENSISRKAVAFVIDYEIRQGREAVDMQSNSKFKGFDILSFSKDKAEIRTIEVKGTQSDGIPDLFETQVTRNKKLVFTHLYVVKFDSDKNPIQLFVIPSSEISPNDLTEKRHYTISSNFQTQRKKNFEVKF